MAIPKMELVKQAGSGIGFVAPNPVSHPASQKTRHNQHWQCICMAFLRITITREYRSKLSMIHYMDLIDTQINYTNPSIYC